MKRFIKNPKKGAAIELALLVIFIAVALSTLIVSFTLTGNKIKQQSFSTLTRQTKADEIMEAYLATGLIIDEDYQIQELDDGDVTTITLLTDDEIWLTVKIKDGKIIQWKY